MRNWFHSIGARIFAGFGLFIAALAVFFVLTARTTKTQSRLLEEAVALDIAKADVAKLLQSVEAMRAYSLLVARLARADQSPCGRAPVPRPAPGWIRRQTQRTQEPVTRTGGSPPTALSPSPTTDALLDHLQGLVPPGTRKTDFDADFDTMVRVDEILDNPFDLGEDLRSRLDSVEAGLQALGNHFEQAVRITDDEVESSGRRLDALVRWISLFVLLAGLGIAAGVTRAIRRPLRKVRARLMYSPGAWTILPHVRPKGRDRRDGRSPGPAG